MATVILSSGGTGGHIFPALSVADALRAEYGNIRVIFVGSTFGPEKDLAAKAGLEFIGLPVRGVLGKGVKGLTSLGYMGISLVKALRLMRRYKPKVVLGFGGYASFAPVLAGRMCGAFTAIHEQNAVMGVSNKLLGRVVHKVFLGLPLHMDDAALQQKCVLMGNPVRKVLLEAGKGWETEGQEHDFSGKRLLVMGGSQGAAALNDIVMEYMPLLRARGVELCHQTGVKDYERVQELYKKFGWHTAQVSAFIDDMAKAYMWADLVLCRAGASTVAELAAVGRGAVFVPFPFATHDHQTHNAASFVKSGAALMYAENCMRGEESMEKSEKTSGNSTMMEVVVDLLHDPAQLKHMAQVARAAAQGQAAIRISVEVQAVLRKKR